MKIAFGILAAILLASAANAQGIGGGLSAPHAFHTLPHEPVADMRQVEVSGTEQDFLPSTFVTFDGAVAAGKVEIKEESKTVAEAAAETRATASPQARIHIIQDNNGAVVFAAK